MENIKIESCVGNEDMAEQSPWCEIERLMASPKPESDWNALSIDQLKAYVQLARAKSKEAQAELFSRKDDIRELSYQDQVSRRTLAQESARLNRAKSQFAQIKRGYIREHRQSTIGSTEELAALEEESRLLTSASGFAEVKRCHGYFRESNQEMEDEALRSKAEARASRKKSNLRKRSTFNAPRELKTSQNYFVFEKIGSNVEIALRPLFDQLSISQIAKVPLSDIKQQLEATAFNNLPNFDAEEGNRCIASAGILEEEQKLGGLVPNTRASTNDESAEKGYEAAQNESMNEAFERAYGVRIFKAQAVLSFGSPADTKEYTGEFIRHPEEMKELIKLVKKYL